MYAHSSNMAANSYIPPIKRLYSLAQSLGLPVDFTESTTASHPRPIFTVRVSVGPFSAEARGPNRREAKTRACVRVINLLDTYQRNHSYANGYTYANSYANLPPHSHPDFGLGKDPCTRLSELLMALKKPHAQYRLLEGTVTGAYWTFSMEVSVDKCTAVGKGGSKKEARRRAAAALLQMMGYAVPEEELVPPAPQTTAEPAPQTTAEPAPHTTAKSAPQTTAEPVPEPENALENQTRAPSAHITPEFRLEKDPTTRLSELQMIRREKVPEYRLVNGELVSGRWVFTVEVTLDQFTTSGSGHSKKEAKRNASTSLLIMMGFKVPETDLLLEKPEESTSEEHSEGQSLQTALVRAEGSETQTSGERCETLSNMTMSPEAPQETPDQENQEESHIPQTTAEDNQEMQPLNSSGSDDVSEETSEESHRHSSHEPAEEEQSKDASDQTGLEELKIIEKYIPETVCAFLKDVFSSPLKVFVDPEPVSSNSSEGYQTLGEYHKGSVENPEDLETKTEIQDLEESETLDTPEDVESPMEVQILEVPKKSQSLDNSKSPEEDQNPQEAETLETPEDLESPMEVQILEVPKKSQSLDNSKSPEEDQNQEETETLDTPEDVESPMEVQILEVPNKSQSLDNSKSPEEDQNPEEAETLETPDDVESPTSGEIGLKQQSPEEEEILNLFDDSSNDNKSPENDKIQEQLDISSEGDLSPIEPQTQEERTPEDTPSLMEVQLHKAEDITAEEEREKLQTEGPASAPEPPAAPQASQTMGSVEKLVLHALVKKLLKKLPSKMRSHHDALVQTLEKVLDQFKVPDDVHIKAKNIKKLGKAGARDLIQEYGSAAKILVIALGPDPTDFQKDTMKHLNFRLSAFINRPRTVLARLFPQWDKPKKRAS